MAAIDLSDGLSGADYPLRLGSAGIMRGRIGRDGEVVTLALAGEFDLSGADAFAAALDEIEATRPHAIVIDVQGLSFMDSTGIKALLAAHRRAAGVRSFAILNGSGPAHRALTLAGLDGFLSMVDHPSELPERPS